MYDPTHPVALLFLFLFLLFLGLIEPRGGEGVETRAQGGG